MHLSIYIKGNEGRITRGKIVRIIQKIKKIHKKIQKNSKQYKKLPINIKNNKKGWKNMLKKIL